MERSRARAEKAVGREEGGTPPRAGDERPPADAAKAGVDAAAAGIAPGERTRGLRDRELLELVAVGDSAGLEALYDRHAPLLYALTLKLLGDAAAAEEVVQDAFWQLWQHPARYDARRGSPRTFLVQVARSRALDRLRLAQRRRRLLEPTEALVDAVIADGSQSLDAQNLPPGAEVIVEVRSALERLSGAQRRVVVLSYFYGMTQEEIAERLAEPVGTVKSRVRRGLLRLRKFLTAGDGETS